jgi:transcriptional regulator with XRE-family HTH domain
MTCEEFKQARKAKKLTQKKLGLLLGYPESTAERIVQHWEYGTQPIPMKHFRKLSEILEIPLERFIP